MKLKTSKSELDRIACSSDSSGICGNALAVFYPGNIERLSAIVQQNQHIVIRGGGSGLAGGAVPLNDVVIDLSKMNKILNIDKIRKTAEVEAGIILDELQAELDKYKLEFPVQPSSHGICTIGGMIATNAAGSRAIKYGKTQNLIEEITVMSPNGSLNKIGKVDLSAYSGMEGITGIIIKAKLKLINKPKRTASLLKFSSLEEMTELVRKLKLEKDVSMIEFFDKKVAELLTLEDAYYLIVEFESERGNLKAEDYEKIMQIRDSIYPLLAGEGYVKIEDPQMYFSKIAEFLEWLEKQKIPAFGHLGTGIIHACFKSEETKKEKETLVVARKLHGNISGEHGIGLAKKQFIDESDKKIIRKIKNRLDPESKFNKDKVIDFKPELENKTQEEKTPEEKETEDIKEQIIVEEKIEEKETPEEKVSETPEEEGKTQEETEKINLEES